MPEVDWGEVEFYVRICADELFDYYKFNIIIQDGNEDNALHVYLYNDGTDRYGKIGYNDGSNHNLMSLSLHKWHHIRILHCPHFFSIYVDGINLGTCDYKGNPIFMDKITFSCIQPVFYLDAIGYSWDPGYEMDDNLCPSALLVDFSTKDLDIMQYSLDRVGWDTFQLTLSGVTYIPISRGDHSLQIRGEKSGIDFESGEVNFTCKDGEVAFFGEPVMGEVEHGSLQDIYWPNDTYYVIKAEKQLFVGYVAWIQFYVPEGPYSTIRVDWWWRWSTHDLDPLLPSANSAFLRLIWEPDPSYPTDFQEIPLIQEDYGFRYEGRNEFIPWYPERTLRIKFLN